LLLGVVKAGKAGAVCGAVSGASVSKVGIGDLQCISLWLALRFRKSVSRKEKPFGSRG
jgi:hypothetical protein